MKYSSVLSYPSIGPIFNLYWPTVINQLSIVMGGVADGIGGGGGNFIDIMKIYSGGGGG